MRTYEITEEVCSECGSTDYEDVHLTDYSACCNEGVTIQTRTVEVK